MKRRPLILVGVLFALFLIPLSFLDVSALTFEYSSESVTSFSETLEDDEMFYPDGYYDPTPVVAYDGGGTSVTNDWEDSLEIDVSRWSIFHGYIEYAYYDLEYAIEGFEFSIYGYSATNDTALQVWNGTAMNNFTVIPATGATDYWYNGTWNAPNYRTDYLVLWIDLDHDHLDEYHYASFDYVEFRFHYAYGSVATEGPAYAETFYNVSEWSNGYLACEAGDTWVSDGDVMTFNTTGDGVNDKDFIYFDFPSAFATDGDFSALYLEIVHKENTISNYDYYKIWLSDTTWGAATTDYIQIELDKSTSWQTEKFNLGTQSVYGTPDNITSIAIGLRHDTGIHHILEFDYIRIGPSNEFGWQHDGSTIDGVTTSANCEVESNGDLLTISTDGGSGNNQIKLDATSTESTLSITYYQFVEYSITSVVEAGSSGAWKLRVYDDDSDYYESGSYTNSTGVFRANIAAAADMDNIRFLRFYLQDSGDSITVDYIKFYSIADFTYDDGGGESTNDYSYVENDNLIVHTDTYTKWNYDPTLSVNITTYPSWNATITNGDTDFRFRELLDTNTLWDQGIVTGSLVGTTLEDFDILIYGNCTISSINFYGIVPEWLVITNVDFVFYVSGWHIINSIVVTFVTEINEYTLNLLLLFLGLAMIPTSTLYLVKGGRDDMSNDKVFYFLIAFAIGWALFLGGIYG